jgi:HD-like signal output (HDOD) protein
MNMISDLISPVIEYGEVENDPPEDLAGAGLAGIVGKLRGLEPFPEAAHRLLLLIWDPEHDSEKVVEIIQSDPSLTARVLRLINSGAFGLRRQCESVRRAVVLMGSQQVAQVAVAQLALDQFRSVGPLGRRICDHCQLVAKLCRTLAARRQRLRNVDLFTPGMLHDIGKLLMLQVDQGDYADMLTEASGEPDTLHALERSRFGYDHAVLAHHVMTQWRLPEQLRTVILLHHDPKGASAVSVTMAESVSVLRLADALSYALPGDPVGDGEKISAIAGSDEAKTLELDAYRLAQLWPVFFELLS